MVFACSASAAAVYESGGPYTPFGAAAPGLGAPFGPLPPPSMFVGAVGSGPVDDALLEDELLLEVLFPELCDWVGVGVKVKTTLEVNVLSTLDGPRVTPVVNDVERIRDWEVEEEFELLCDC